jgi:hypothetical protein
MTFVSVTGGTSLSNLLAPLRAYRSLGKLGDDRLAEFGLAEPEGTLRVQVGGAEHKLFIGGTTPGGSHRYARDPDTGECYALLADVYNYVTVPRMLRENQLHAWNDTEVRRAHIATGGKARDLVRAGGEGDRSWSDRATPDQKDETAENWMAKVDALHAEEYLANEPPGHELVLRIEYSGTSSPGYLELHKAPGANGTAAYFVVTEHIRRFAKVAQGAGEQVLQDVGSIVR